jgi:hypothetical protein
MRENSTSDCAAALAIVAEQMKAGVAAKKCHSCGCFQAAVASFEQTEPGRHELASVLAGARAVLVDRKYDCLGCAVCFPAIAENAFADAFPGAVAAPLCPTGVPAARRGWPPLPGDYKVVRHGAPVAVCTLNTTDLAAALAARAPRGLAIAGTLHTENLGIERIVRNVLSNPHLRFLVVCGQDTQQAIGHLPGQSLAALCENGVDEAGRIRGAHGKHLLGWVKVPLPTFSGAAKAQGVLGAFASGLLLSLVLAPCGTPVLASVLSFAAYKQSPMYGGALLFVYGLGMGLPILVLGAAATGVARRLDRLGWRAWVDRIAGSMLLALGFYLLWVA